MAFATHLAMRTVSTARCRFGDGLRGGNEDFESCGKRNKARFSQGFMFQLTLKQFENLKLQNTDASIFVVRAFVTQR